MGLTCTGPILTWRAPAPVSRSPDQSEGCDEVTARMAVVRPGR